MKSKKAKSSFEEIGSGILALAVVFLLAISIPEVKAYVDQLFITILSAIFIGLIAFIILFGIWFFFFKNN